MHIVIVCGGVDQEKTRWMPLGASMGGRYAMDTHEIHFGPTRISTSTVSRWCRSRTARSSS